MQCCTCTVQKPTFVKGEVSLSLFTRRVNSGLNMIMTHNFLRLPKFVMNAGSVAPLCSSCLLP